MTVCQPICLSDIGLKNKLPYLAHSLGNWGPESEGSECLEHPFEHDGEWWVFNRPTRVLIIGEQFKIVVPKITLEEAHLIHRTRVDAGVHESELRMDAPEGENFDFDPKTECMWFLANDNPNGAEDGYPTFRAGKWNRNSVFTLVLQA